MVDPDKPSKQVPAAVPESPESPTTKPSLPSSLERTLPDGRTVQVFLPGMPGYEEAGRLVESFKQEQTPPPQSRSEAEFDRWVEGLPPGGTFRLKRPDPK
jgi:hypothetical protein